jgi:ribosomal protein S6--L-glutamate ligase
MKMVSFNAYRTIGIPGVHYIKPEHMFKEIETIRQADIVLFPETWQVPALVYGLKKKIFPSIETLQLGFSKAEMTRALWTVAPEHVPYTEILANTPSNIEYILETFPYPFVAKEARNSMGKGTFLIKEEKDFYEYAKRNEVLYVQEYLENDGKDLRICVVGNQIFTSYWRVGLEGEFLHNVAQGGELCFDFIPQEACDLVLQVANELNINHAGFDVMVSGGKYYILEFNVLFGNQGIHSKGLSVEQAIYKYLLTEFMPPFPTSPITSNKIIS